MTLPARSARSAFLDPEATHDMTGEAYEYAAPQLSGTTSDRSDHQLKNVVAHIRRVRAGVLTVLAVALLTGCGGSEERTADEPRATDQPSQDARTVEGVLGRRDAPPADVRRQAEYFAVGGPVAGGQTTGPPKLMLDQFPAGADDPEIGETLRLYVDGLGSDEPVELLLGTLQERPYACLKSPSPRRIAVHGLSS